MGRGDKNLSNEEAEAELIRLLNESGKKEELREKLMNLLAESGWRDQVKLYVMEVVHEKGAEKAKMEDLIQEVAPKAVSYVPDSARKKLAKDIKKFLAEQEE